MKTSQDYITGSVALDDDFEDITIENPEAGQIIINAHQEQIEVKKRYSYFFFKRAFDIAASFFGMLLLSPVFLIIAVVIKIESEGKVFYSQRRVGRNGKVFKMFKFRSMVHNADEILMKFTPEQRAEFEVNFKLENDPRITKSGDFLRKTSLDELPQLLNIFLGSLSVVGPRPIVEYETYKYGEQIEKLLSVKPGLTGYWQVSGRSDTTYEERVEMEMYYIDECSMLLDLKIFFKTFKTVVTKKGSY